MATTSEVRPEVHIADILRQALPGYLDKYGSLSAQHWKALNAIPRCRTESMGASQYTCDNCGAVSVHYHSCRDRHCPRCQGTARAAWVHARSRELLPVGYFHVVFTISRLPRRQTRSPYGGSHSARRFGEGTSGEGPRATRGGRHVTQRHYRADFCRTALPCTRSHRLWRWSVTLSSRLHHQLAQR